MCQLNLYIVPKGVPKEEVISIFEKHNLYIIQNSHYNLNNLARNNEFYFTGSGCDCSSIISKLREENDSNFNSYKIRKKNEDIEKLNRMKRLKTSKGYKTKVKSDEKIVNEYEAINFDQQFSDLKNIFTDVLKFAKEIYIYPFWQDGELLEIKGERQVTIENLNIEDLIFLPYKNLLQIKAISK